MCRHIAGCVQGMDRICSALMRCMPPPTGHALARGLAVLVLHAEGHQSKDFGPTFGQGHLKSATLLNELQTGMKKQDSSPLREDFSSVSCG